LRLSSKSINNPDLNLLFSFGLVIILISSVLFCIIYYLINLDLLRSILTFLMSVFVSLHFLILNNLQSNFKIKGYRNIELLRSLSMIVIPLLIVLLWRRSIYSIVIAIEIVYLISVFYSSLVLINFNSIIINFTKDHLSFLKKIFSFAFPVTLWLSIMNLFPVIDRIILEKYFNYTVLGEYTKAYDLIIRSFSLVYFPITAFIHPKFMELINTNNLIRAKGLLLKGVASFAVITILILLLAFSFFSLNDYYHYFKIQIPLLVIINLVLAGSLWQFALLIHKPSEAKNKTLVMLFNIFISFSVYTFYLIAVKYFFSVLNITHLSAAYLFSSLVYSLLSLKTFYIFITK
jgi:O-antigen/teichoic acid export membrane protein